MIGNGRADDHAMCSGIEYVDGRFIVTDSRTGRRVFDDFGQLARYLWGKTYASEIGDVVEVVVSRDGGPLHSWRSS